MKVLNSQAARDTFVVMCGDVIACSMLVVRLANGPQMVRAIFLALLTFMVFKSFITLLLIPTIVARETVMLFAMTYF